MKRLQNVELFLEIFYASSLKFWRGNTVPEALNLKLPSGPDLPVRCNVTHEQDAGVHVEIEGGGTKVTVDLAEEDGAAGVVSDSDGETEADEEVGGCQVLQVDGDTAGRLLLSSAEVNPQGEAVEEQTHLQGRQELDL